MLVCLQRTKSKIVERNGNAPTATVLLIIVIDIYFIGGFGTVAWVNVKEYEILKPDRIVVDGGEHILKELNAIFSKPLKELLSKEAEVDDAAFISIDSRGVDIRARQGAQGKMWKHWRKLRKHFGKYWTEAVGCIICRSEMDFV